MAKKRKANEAFMKKLSVSPELAAIIGPTPVSRGEMMKKIWAYIKRRGLQDEDNRRMIIADDKLKAIFGRKKAVSMFEMTKLLSAHIGEEFGGKSKKVGRKNNPADRYEYIEEEEDMDIYDDEEYDD
jgi:chromatin remodeling complex protein RSC6